MRNIVSVVFLFIMLHSSTLSLAQNNNVIKREIFPLIQRFENNFILLGNINDSSNWMYYKEDLKSEIFNNQNPYVFYDLQQNYNYRDTIALDKYLAILSESFYDGFIYKLDMQNVVLSNKNVLKDSLCQIAIKIPRTFRGIWKPTMKVISVNDTIVFEFLFVNKNDAISNIYLKTFKLKEGRPNKVPFSYAKVLSLKDSLNYYLKVISSSHNKNKVIIAEEKIKSNINDTIITIHNKTTDVFEKYPISLFLHREETLNYKELSVESFDAVFITNFYQDVDNNYYGDRIVLKNVIPSIENKEKYSDKIIDVSQVNQQVAKHNSHIYYINNVILIED